ncbi:MAG: glycosyltransferase family 2 protein [Candidatus Marsarchaeota archaeon]|nr:glycosyltransferase family 2 protein [Candidatus Marsarchaeota archaeon]
MPIVSIVVLNWSQLEDTCECLASLRDVTYADYHVIVVDNGSVDGSPDVIADRYPEVRLIRNEQNLGFVGGNNVGIEAALQTQADYVLLLNNDTVVDPGMVSILVEVAEADSRIAAVGPQIFYYDEPTRLWFLGADVGWPLAKVEFWHQNEENPYPQRQVVETDYLAGAGMLIRTSIIRQLGAFDPYFFAYWDDVELCVRFARAGYQIKAVTHAHMWHKIPRAGRPGKTIHFLMARNQFYLCRKYNNWRVFWPRVVPALIHYRLRRLASTRFSQESVAGIRGTLAYLGGYQGREGIPGI